MRCTIPYFLILIHNCFSHRFVSVTAGLKGINIFNLHKSCQLENAIFRTLTSSYLVYLKQCLIFPPNLWLPCWPTFLVHCRLSEVPRCCKGSGEGMYSHILNNSAFFVHRWTHKTWKKSDALLPLLNIKDFTWFILLFLAFAMGFKYKESTFSFLMCTFFWKNPLLLVIDMNNTDVWKNLLSLNRGYRFLSNTMECL